MYTYTRFTLLTLLVLTSFLGELFFVVFLKNGLFKDSFLEIVSSDFCHRSRCTFSLVAQYANRGYLFWRSCIANLSGEQYVHNNVHLLLYSSVAGLPFSSPSGPARGSPVEPFDDATGSGESAPEWIRLKPDEQSTTTSARTGGITLYLNTLSTNKSVEWIRLEMGRKPTTNPYEQFPTAFGTASPTSNKGLDLEEGAQFRTNIIIAFVVLSCIIGVLIVFLLKFARKRSSEDRESNVTERIQLHVVS